MVLLRLGSSWCIRSLNWCWWVLGNVLRLLVGLKFEGYTSLLRIQFRSAFNFTSLSWRFCVFEVSSLAFLVACAQHSKVTPCLCSTDLVPTCCLLKRRRTTFLELFWWEQEDLRDTKKRKNSAVPWKALLSRRFRGCTHTHTYVEIPKIICQGISSLNGPQSWDALNRRNQRGEIEQFFQMFALLFADFRLTVEIKGFGSGRFRRNEKAFRRRPQIFAGTTFFRLLLSPLWRFPAEVLAIEKLNPNRKFQSEIEISISIESFNPGVSIASG